MKNYKVTSNRNVIKETNKQNKEILYKIVNIQRYTQKNICENKEYIKSIKSV